MESLRKAARADAMPEEVQDPECSGKYLTLASN